jgi:hypothetical protein
MHIGHFHSHVNQRIRRCNPTVNGFFSELAWQTFLQAGAAARLQALTADVREPCCSLRYIGGDGTAIGVPIANLGGIKPVWEPPLGLREPFKKWGRLNRCAIGNNCGVSASDAKECREYLQQATCPRAFGDSRLDIRNHLDTISDSLPPEILALLESWFGINHKDPRWEPIRHLLRACAYQDSLCGVVTLPMIPVIKRLTELACKTSPFATAVDIAEWESLIRTISKDGLGPYLAQSLTACREYYLINNQAGKSALLVLSGFLQYIGE